MLGRLEITSLLIEGGATVNGAALSAGVVDKIFLYYAPMILAGSNAIPFAAGTGFSAVKRRAACEIAQDSAFRGRLRGGGIFARPVWEVAIGNQEVECLPGSLKKSDGWLVKSDGGRRRLTVSASRLVKELKQGDSIAVSGVCLTAVEITAIIFPRTWLMRAGSALLFHGLRKGHRSIWNFLCELMDDLEVTSSRDMWMARANFAASNNCPEPKIIGYALRFPRDWRANVIHKGSLSIEGISLTVAEIEGTRVTAAIIPHTTEMTNLKSLKPGDAVNLEVDMIAKYVEKMIAGRTNDSLTVKSLVKRGF